MPLSPGRRSADTVSAHLRRLVQVFLAVCVIVAGAGFVSLAVANQALDDTVDRIDPLRAAQRDVLDAALDAGSQLRGYQQAWDPAFLTSYREALGRYETGSARARDLADGDDDLLARFATQDERFAAWRAYAAEVERLGQEDVEAAEVLVRTDQGRTRLAEVRTANDAIMRALDASDRRAADRSQAFATGAAVVTVVALLGGIAFGVLAARRVRHQVAEPVEALGETITALRTGDRSARAHVDGTAELRDLTQAFNRLAAENQELADRQAARIAAERQVRTLTHEMRGTLDPQTLAALAAAGLGRATGAERVAVRAVSDIILGGLEGEWTAPGITPTDAMPFEPDPRLTAHVLDDLVAGVTVLLEGMPHHPDLPPEAFASFTDDGWCSVAVVPVSRQGTVHALIVLEARDPEHRWSPEAIRLAEAVALELGVALQTARLFDQERTMVTRLRQVDQAKSDFVSSVSHELRTPLTSIRGYVEMLQDGDAGAMSDPQRRMLDVVERNADRLLSLIEDLLTLSRIESGSFKVTLADVDLGPLVAGCAEAVAPQARTADVDLRVEVDHDLPTLRGDANQLERVVLNLLTNAIKFSPGGGRVRLTGSRAGGEVVIEVADEGMGIPAEEQDRLFTRFFRSSTAQEQAVPGTGLGLVIAKTAVDNHGGTIAVRSQPGQGTTFTVRLPAGAAHPAPAVAP